MKLKLHPLIRTDIDSALDYLDSKSNFAGDHLLEEITQFAEHLRVHPLRYPPFKKRFRKCNLKRFSYHLIYEVFEDSVGILVIRHHHRHPDYGLNRTWTE